MPSYNYFPATYNTNYPAYSNLQPTYPQQQPSGIIWVQGEAGAKAYPVPPGSSMVLMDAESEQFFVKTTDTNGMPQPLRTYEYTEVVTTQSRQEAPNMDGYATKEDIAAINRRLDGLTRRREKNGEQSI